MGQSLMTDVLLDDELALEEVLFWVLVQAGKASMSAAANTPVATNAIIFLIIAPPLPIPLSQVSSTELSQFKLFRTASTHQKAC